MSTRGHAIELPRPRQQDVSIESSGARTYRYGFPVADVKGNLHDTVHVRKPTALDGALVKGFEKQALPAETVPVDGDDVIYMFPKMFERQVEVLMFVASAPAIPGKQHDLSSSSKLEFAVSYTGAICTAVERPRHRPCEPLGQCPTPPRPTTWV